MKLLLLTDSYFGTKSCCRTIFNSDIGDGFEDFHKNSGTMILWYLNDAFIERNHFSGEAMF